MAAEPADDSLLEEVIVTAERRATKEQTTAISMAVLSNEDLASRRTQNIQDLQQATPNVTINQAGPYNFVNIRGVGNTIVNPAITTGVAVFQDGVLTAETVTLGSAFLDLGSIEVLRGPQGTFVGASSTGGAIRMNSVRPSLNGETSGYAEALIGSKRDVKMTGAVNVPLTDTLAARVAVNSEKRDSYFYNAGSKGSVAPARPFTQPGSVQDTNGRLSLLWAPNEQFEAVWRSELNRSDNQGAPFQPNPRTFTNSLGQQTHSRYWNYDDPGHDPDVLYLNTYETHTIGTVDRHSLELNYTFANQLRVRSLTAYVHNETQVINDTDGSIANAGVQRNDIGPNNPYYFQEVNLISPEGPLNWILGGSLFYRKTPFHLVQEGSAACGIDPVLGTSTPCPTEYTSNNAAGFPQSLNFFGLLSTVRSAGLFGQLNWKFIDTLELTAGARMNYDNNFQHGDGHPDEFGVTSVFPLPPGTPLGPPGGPATAACYADIAAQRQLRDLPAGSYSCFRVSNSQASFSDKTPTWKVGLNWTPTDRNFVYAFWSRGYKSGGVDQGIRFEPEKVDDYELGWKGGFLDGRARLSLSGFWMEYDDMQQSVFLAPVGGTAASRVVNAGASTIKGVELELNARLPGGFGVDASASYTDSSLDGTNVIDRQAVPIPSIVGQPDPSQCAPGVAPSPGPAGCFDYTPYYRTVSGTRNLYTPKVSYNVGLDYAFRLGNGASLTPRVGFVHTDEQDTNLVRREAYYSIPKRDLLNVSLTYAVNDWIVQGYCNNCADKTYIASVDTDGASVFYGDPRNYGVRVRRTF